MLSLQGAVAYAVARRFLLYVGGFWPGVRVLFGGEYDVKIIDKNAKEGAGH